VQKIGNERFQFSLAPKNSLSQKDEDWINAAFGFLLLYWRHLLSSIAPLGMFNLG
jgi:hypothetical protein